MNSVCILGHQINKEQLKGGASIRNTKKDSILIQSKPMR